MIGKRIIIGQFLCTRVQNILGQIKFAIHLPGLGHIVIPDESGSDVREGDLLTLYTYIPMKEPPNAPPS